MEIEAIFQYWDYNPETHENDISLLKTRRNMTLDQTNANKARFPAIPLSYGLDLNITGWGSKEPGSTEFSEYLQLATLVNSDQTECNRTLGGKLSKNMLCAKPKEGTICSTNGDRGGPGINSKTLYGILITWYDACNENENYEIFTDVYQYYNWIIMIINEYYTTPSSTFIV